VESEFEQEGCLGCVNAETAILIAVEPLLETTKKSQESSRDGYKRKMFWENDYSRRAQAQQKN
jgi:hypothetical protein